MPNAGRNIGLFHNRIALPYESLQRISQDIISSSKSILTAFILLILTAMFIIVPSIRGNLTSLRNRHLHKLLSLSLYLTVLIWMIPRTIDFIMVTIRSTHLYTNSVTMNASLSFLSLSFMTTKFVIHFSFVIDLSEVTSNNTRFDCNS